MTRERPLRDLIIYCDRASNTARELARRLNARRLYASPNHRLRSTNGSLCINYGTSHNPNFGLGEKSIILNPPEAVSKAISKRISHALFKAAGVPTLELTEDQRIATSWVREGVGVLCRRDGLSHGAGIIYVPKGSETCPDSDFYTKYFPKTHEYRAHVFKGKLIDLTQKRLQNGVAQVEDRDSVARIVRSLDNGWIHAHSFDLGPVQKAEIEKSAVAALDSLGLDFGAVDILAKVSAKHPQRPPVLAVCEVNTAPGLANEQTLAAYVQAITQHYIETKSVRTVVLAKTLKRKKVKKLVPVTFVSRKGNRITRMRERYVYE